ncbi:hypothetical protein AGMMS50222_04750 [Endomicrobiia bacterium]|nr:hypothetical protein AGMMS49556_04770 [Endomicrobiia bacterium]GHT74836.1 hypothetical protein AGMMS50222_04690 [Endomicrobiia bacterium]GHT74853.1 hypothetical protein AGMMS50222_04750 [Endomicrobiia bacterium]
MTNRLDISSATETLALAASPELDKSKVRQRTIAVRINEIDYNRLNSLFVAQGTNLSAAGRAAIFFLAEHVEAGKLTIPNGVIYRAKNV